MSSRYCSEQEGEEGATQREREREKDQISKFFSHNFSQEPAKSKALGRGTFFFNKATYGGEKGSNSEVASPSSPLFCSLVLLVPVKSL
jgi:hypothetical protein